MTLRTSEPFEESDDRQIPTSDSSIGNAFYVQIVSWIFIILAAILAITALARCSAVQEEQPAVAQQVATRSRSNLGEESRMIKILIEVVTASKKSAARVPQSRVLIEVNTSQVISCESQGDEPLSSCLWGRTIKGQRQVITVDEHVVEGGGRTKVDGISYVGNGLEDGKCAIKIESVSEDDAGSWSCTLVSHNGSVFTGIVEITTEEIEPSIYWASSGSGGLKAYSVATSQTTSIISGGTDLYGVAYDSLRDRIYWSSSSTIKRADRDGRNVETVLSTSTYGTMYTIEFDWIGGNLYVATSSGYILACYGGTKKAFSCSTLLSSQGEIRGLALDPNEGLMFWTTSGGSIVRAGMDGSDRVTIATYPSSSANELRGITIDFQNSRLCWVSANGNKIQSSNADGGSVETILSLPSGSWPIGIGIFGDRIYWTTHGNYMVKSCTKTGQDVQTLYTGSSSLFHLAIVPELYPPAVRTNHCEKLSCTGVCVLTPTSSRCVS